MTRENLISTLSFKEAKEDGKNLLKALTDCQKGEDVMELLRKRMSNKDIAERIKNVNDEELINNIDATKATIRMGLGTHRNQDVVCAATQKWCKLTGKDIRSFKKEMALYMMSHTQEKTDAQKLAAQLIVNRAR